MELSGRANGTHILLVDDDKRSQISTSKLLEFYGYRVDMVGNGIEALKALEEEDDYALVLLDCMMPLMDGYQVAATIRDPDSSVRRHNIPIIALTGYTMNEDRDRCLKSGMNDHISKPILLPDLLAKVCQWVNPLYA